MDDTRYFTARTAGARYAPGLVSLMGRPLRVLSLHHEDVLNEILGKAWHEDGLDLATLNIASLICTERSPTAIIPMPVGDEEKQRYLSSLLQFDEEAQRAIWDEYYYACYGSQPRIAKPGGNAKYHSWRAPSGALLVVYILRRCPGFTHDELYKDKPASEVHWLLEAAHEQETGKSRILPDKAPPEPTPEETAARKTYEKLAAKIVQHCAQKRRALGKPVKGNARQQEALAAIATEQQRLLALARNGKLAEDLTEIP